MMNVYLNTSYTSLSYLNNKYIYVYTHTWNTNIIIYTYTIVINVYLIYACAFNNIIPTNIYVQCVQVTLFSDLLENIYRSNFKLKEKI
jgi:hypothetical protein